MHKEVVLKTVRDGVEKTAHVLVYDNIEQLKAFYDRLGIEFEREGSFVYKSIDEDNKAYVVRTSAEVNEGNVRAWEFLEKILDTVNGMGSSDLLPDGHKWSIGYVANEFGIEIRWQWDRTAETKCSADE